MKKLSAFIFVLTLISCANLKDPSFIEILDNSQNDIKVDSVKYFTAGLPFIRPILSKTMKETMSAESLKSIESLEIKLDKIQIEQKLIKSIYSKYGLYQINLGCMIDKQTSILSKQYKKITYPYLEQRNGKGWEGKMEKEIGSINKIFN